jgi:hypothetical protein|tara:strand:- start:61 stop:741 length:681 start_codon:yes stop_codon:yes gene_type:complete
MKNFKLFLAEGKKWGGDTFPKKGDLVKLEYQIKLKDYETIATIVKVGKPPLVMKLKPERVSSWDDKKKFGWYNGKYKVDAKTFDGLLKITVEYEHIEKGKIKEVFEQQVSNLNFDLGGKGQYHTMFGYSPITKYDKKFEGGSWSYGKLVKPGKSGKSSIKRNQWDGESKIKVGMYVDYEESSDGQGDVTAKVIKISGRTYTIEYSDTDGSGEKIIRKVDKRELSAA